MSDRSPRHQEKEGREGKYQWGSGGLLRKENPQAPCIKGRSLQTRRGKETELMRIGRVGGHVPGRPGSPSPCIYLRAPSDPPSGPL
eukprot:1146698-Pelagomonas_calceolata.AAC.2